MKFELVWCNLEDKGVYSGEAPDAKTFLIQAIQAKISSLDWCHLYVWNGEKWENTNLIK